VKTFVKALQSHTMWNF